MATELATGYVNLVPSARGFGRGLSRAITPALDRAGKTGGDAASRSFGSRLISGVTGLGGRIASTIGTGLKVGAGVVGGVFATAFGKAVTGGVSRLLSLEDAQNTLENMGLSTKQIDGLMASLNDTLSGTPYALDQGASALARFVSSGIDLDMIPGILQSVTDAAAFGKADLNEVAGIFNRIGTNGKLSALELEMLTDRGIPALSLLADAAGVSATEFRAMVSSNEVSAEDFFRLWEEGAQGFGENNIEMAGAAKGAGETTRGAWANMMTSLSRFGALIAGPIFGLARGFFTSVSGWVDDAGASLRAWAESVDWQAVWSDVLAAFRPVRDAVGGFVDWIAGVDWGGLLSGAAGAFGSVADAIAGVDWAGMLSDVGDVVSPIVESIAGVDWGGLFDGLMDVLGEVVDFIGRIDFGALWAGAMDMAAPVVDGLTNIVTAGVELVQTVLPPLVEGFRILWPAIQVVGVALGVAAYIMHKVFVVQLNVVAGVIRVVAGVIGWFANNVTLPAMRFVMAAVTTAWGVIRPVFSALASIITGTVVPAVQRILAVARPVFSAVSSAVTAAWRVISPVFGAIVRFITGQLVGTFTRFRGTAEAVWRAVSSTITSAWRGISGTFTAFRSGLSSLVSFVSGRVDGIRSAFQRVVGPIRGAMTGLASGIRSAFASAFGGIRSAWNSGPGGFGFSVPSWVPGVGGKSFSIPNMHVGGVVPGTAADEVLRVLQGGEVVLSRADVARLHGTLDAASPDDRVLVVERLEVLASPNGRVLAEATDIRTLVGRLRTHSRAGGKSL